MATDILFSCKHKLSESGTVCVCVCVGGGGEGGDFNSELAIAANGRQKTERALNIMATGISLMVTLLARWFAVGLTLDCIKSVHPCSGLYTLALLCNLSRFSHILTTCFLIHSTTLCHLFKLCNFEWVVLWGRYEKAHVSGSTYSTTSLVRTS